MNYASRKALALRALYAYPNGWATAAELGDRLGITGPQAAGLLRSLQAERLVTTNAPVAPGQWWPTVQGERSLELFAEFAAPTQPEEEQR